MRRWQVIGGMGSAVVIAGVIALQSAAGEGTQAEPAVVPGSGPGAGDGGGGGVSAGGGFRPFKPPKLSPGAIPLEQQSAAEQQNIEAAKQRLDSTQPTSSYQAYSDATDVTIQRAQAEIAARKVGLEGTAEDGVAP